MKILIYGAGVYLQNVISDIDSFENTIVVGIADSNPELWGKKLFDYIILPPNEIEKCEYDYVVITSIHAVEIEKRLIEIGIENKRILRYEEYKAHFSGSVNKEFVCNDDKEKKKIVFVTPHLGFHGASLAGLFALVSLECEEYAREMIAPEGNIEFIDYVLSKGINVRIIPDVMFCEYEKIQNILDSDILILNTYVSFHIASKLNGKHRGKTIWWIHESESVIRNNIRKYGKPSDNVFENTKVYCVSSVAQENFNRYFPLVKTDILEVGIPDYGYKVKTTQKNGKIRFAIIGDICRGKGQDVFLSSLKYLNEEEIDKCEFEIIGNTSDESFFSDLVNEADNYGCVRFVKSMPHSELMKHVSDMDLVLCVSRYETLSMAVIEGMMLGKPCIVADSAGIIKYASEEQGLFHFKSEDEIELSKQIKLIVNNPELIYRCSEKIRKQYETHFSIRALSKRFWKAINE